MIIKKKFYVGQYNFQDDDDLANSLTFHEYETDDPEWILFDTVEANIDVEIPSKTDRDLAEIKSLEKVKKKTMADTEIRLERIDARIRELTALPAQ